MGIASSPSRRRAWWMPSMVEAADPVVTHKAHDASFPPPCLKGAHRIYSMSLSATPSPSRSRKAATSKCHARRGGQDSDAKQPLTRAAALDQVEKKAATARGPGATRSAPAATRSRAAAHFVQAPASRSRSTASGRAPRQRETTPRSARGPGASPARPSIGTKRPTRHRPARSASRDRKFLQDRGSRRRTLYHAIQAVVLAEAQSIATCVEINQ